MLAVEFTATISTCNWEEAGDQLATEGGQNTNVHCRMHATNAGSQLH